MPYPNEHACRLRDPADFQSDSFRRIPREHEGKKYDAIIGRLKGEEVDGYIGMTDQAYRYPKETWSVSEARAHCKDHDGILFEEASDEGGALTLGAGQGAGSRCIQRTPLPCCGEDEPEITVPQNERSLRQSAMSTSAMRTSAMRTSAIYQAFIRRPWAILPEKLAVLQEIVIRHVNGEKLDAEEVQMVIHGAKRPANRQEGKIAILPLFGTIFPRANLMTQTSGATSAEIWGEQFDELVKDPEVRAIVLDVDSPGGYTQGIEELSRKIYEARGKKRIVAVANHTMASAAYWIGTAADEVVVTPSGAVGSIGVWAAHDDESGALAQAGIKRTLISAGKYKLEGNPWEPLSEEARSGIQINVDERYTAFTREVARNRGVKVGEVRGGFGEGRMMDAKPALELGMVDRIGTLEETIRRLQRETFRLSDEEQRQAEDLRIRVSSILKKEQPC